ncbi:hypothetical protein BGZ80_003317 [Entomortierella chlamydospora]|uniref:Uncharacterized protein n=1 Tax=Entomortierella chlamydospora TaxID=101097 RepID=A0A9P6N0V4_9FUNG|nr:hypothetical protein BGZ80_003317 [Entomortierella chlamydospora]
MTDDNPMEARDIVLETQMFGSSPNQQSDRTMLTLSTSANSNDANIDPHGQIRIPDSCPPQPGMNEYDLCLVGSVMQDPFADGSEEHQKSTMAAVDRIEGFRDSGIGGGGDGAGAGALSDPANTPLPPNNRWGNESYTTSMPRTPNEDASMDANAEKDNVAKPSVSASQPEASSIENAVLENPLQRYTPFDADSWSNTIAEHKARTVQNFHLITQSLDSINAELQYVFCEFLTQQYNQIEETLKSGHERILQQEKAQGKEEEKSKPDYTHCEFFDSILTFLIAPCGRPSSPKERMQTQIISFVNAVKSAFQILDGSEYN